jgi:hypothetical protein
VTRGALVVAERAATTLEEDGLGARGRDERDAKPDGGHLPEPLDETGARGRLFEQVFVVHDNSFQVL